MEYNLNNADGLAVDIKVDDDPEHGYAEVHIYLSYLDKWFELPVNDYVWRAIKDECDRRIRDIY